MTRNSVDIAGFEANKSSVIAETGHYRHNWWKAMGSFLTTTRLGMEWMVGG